LALALTSAGVYSIVAYTATLRAREIGIRVALGATPGEVVALIVRGAMLPLTAGLIFSAVGALFFTRLLASILYEIKATDPATYIGAAVVMLGIGAIASARPAWIRRSGGSAAGGIDRQAVPSPSRPRCKRGSERGESAHAERLREDRHVQVERDKTRDGRDHSLLGD